ncbi:MAG: short chain dehydrogenase [Parachlamydiaceae bacterium]
MKIILIGGTGTIGKAIENELGKRHDLIVVGHSKGEFVTDITNRESVLSLFKKTGKVDAIVMATGKIAFAPMDHMDLEKYYIGINDKLMGQVNVVLLGRDFLNDGGSFTLTSGILSRVPIVSGSSASMVNAAIEGFVIGASIELPRGERINCVSPTVILESMKDYGPFFRGFEPAPAARVALAYSRSVEGKQTGQIYRVE